MSSLKPAFDRAQAPHFGLSPLATMFWIVAIDDDRQRREREKERRRKRQADAPPRHKPVPPAPKPF